MLCIVQHAIYAERRVSMGLPGLVLWYVLYMYPSVRCPHRFIDPPWRANAFARYALHIPHFSLLIFPGDRDKKKGRFRPVAVEG